MDGGRSITPLGKAHISATRVSLSNPRASRGLAWIERHLAMTAEGQDSLSLASSFDVPYPANVQAVATSEYFEAVVPLGLPKFDIWEVDDEFLDAFVPGRYDLPYHWSGQWKGSAWNELQTSRGESCQILRGEAQTGTLVTSVSAEPGQKVYVSRQAPLHIQTHYPLGTYKWPDFFRFCSQLPNIQGMDLGEARELRDEHLRLLDLFPKLRVLGPPVSQISDAGLRHLQPLQQLQRLDLTCDWNVTDDSLIFLRSLRQLVHLNISFTSISDDGAQLLLEDGKTL